MYKIFLLVFLNPLLSSGQEKELDSSAINKTIQVIEELSKTNNVHYNKLKSINNKKFNEAWQYFENKEYLRLIIEYQIDSTVYSEKYYFKKGLLIFAYLLEFQFYPHLGVDQYTIWSGDFYFSNGKLIDHVTTGHGRSELDDWDPEKEILQRLEGRKAELKLLIKSKKGRS